MKELIDAVLEGYGSMMRAETEEMTEYFRAFLQPVTQKGWENTKKLIGSLGRIPKEQYVCIAPAGSPLEEGAKVKARGQTYLVRRSETMYLAEEAVYTWALLTKAGGEAPWSS